MADNIRGTSQDWQPPVAPGTVRNPAFKPGMPVILTSEGYGAKFRNERGDWLKYYSNPNYVYEPEPRKVAPTTPLSPVQFAESHGMGTDAALATINRYRSNPNADEFRNLKPAEIQDLNRASGLPRGTNLAEVGGGREIVTKAALAKAETETPYQADLLKRAGALAYNESLRDIRTAEAARDAAAERREVAKTTAPITAADSQYKDWTAYELITGKTENGVYIPSPYGVKDGVYEVPPVWVQNKIIEAGNKAIKDIDPYLRDGYTQKDIQAAVNQGISKKDLARMVTQEGQKYVDIIAASKAGKETELKLVGISADDIQKAKIQDSLNTAIIGHEQLRPKEKEQLISQINEATKQLYKTDYLKFGGEMVLDILPVIGTVREIQRDVKDGKITASEAGLIAINVAADIAFIAAATSAASVGARAALQTTRAARLAGATKGLGEFALAEAKAPYLILRHPLETTKDILKLGETMLRRTKLPLASVEVSTATVRLPARAFASSEEAMTVRDIGALAAMREGRFRSKIGDIELDLTPARIQSVGQPVAIHAAPDVTPFLEGATIRAGREGGLYLAPNLHSRFTIASAFGDLPEGGIRGAVIIRDQAILDKLGGSGKVYKNTVEIEALLKEGIQLPKPSQVLFTRAAKADTTAMLKEAKKLRAAGKIEDALALEKKAATLKKAGDKVMLLVIGKPYTAKEIAKLKFLGATDNIKQIFSPSATLKGAQYAREYDDLNDLRKEANELVKEAARLRKAGQVEESIRVEQRADELILRATRMAERLSSPAAYAGTMRLVNASTGRDTIISRLNALEGYRTTPEIRVTEKQLRRISEIISRDPRVALDLQRRGAEAMRDIIDRMESPHVLGMTERARVAIEREATRGAVTERTLTATREATPSRADVSVRTGEGARAAEGVRATQPAKTVMPITRTSITERPTTGRNRITTIEINRPTMGRTVDIPPDATDSEKRAKLDQAEGLIARRRGELAGKSVWHIRYWPYREQDKVILLGDPPAGVKDTAGPGSLKRSATLVRGIPPKVAFREDTGAVDDIIIPKGRGIEVKPVKDTAVRHNSTPKAPKKPTMSRKIGNQYYTRVGRHTAISRRPLRI